MIDPVEARFGALVALLQPAARQRLAQSIAAALRKSQAARIAAQQNPDGSAFGARKPQRRQRKKNLRVAMFGQLRTAKYLKVSASADQAIVTFARDVQRIARVHQFGLRDKVSRSGPEADYPARRLLGFSEEEKNAIAGLITTYLASMP